MFCFTNAVCDNSEKQRAPAWCDRILWYGSGVKECRAYKRVEILSSDHRPVTGIYSIEAKCVLIEQKQLVARDIVKQLDRQENKKIPQCSLSTNKLDFGPVKLNKMLTKTIIVTNQTMNTVRNFIR